MTDLEIKEAVRERDGYKCRDCGMTREQHQEKYGKDLDVHRLIPGTAYAVSWCVTLCRACHGKKPKSALDAICSQQEGKNDVLCFFFNRYAPDDSSMVDMLESKASCEGIGVGVLIGRILEDYFKDWREHDRADLLMMADGLW